MKLVCLQAKDWESLATFYLACADIEVQSFRDYRNSLRVRGEACSPCIGMHMCTYLLFNASVCKKGTCWVLGRLCVRRQSASACQRMA